MVNMQSSRPRGRPRTFDREEALGAARLTFWQLGYEGASIADLTAAMGITPQSLYAAFSSKANLYCETLAQYRRSAGAFVWAALAGEATAAAAFRRILTEAAREYARGDQPAGCMLSTAVTTCAVEHRLIADHVAVMREEARAAFRARIERGIEEGDVPADVDVPVTARFVQAMIQGLSIQARDGAGEADLAAIAEMACAQLDGRLSATT